MKKLFTLLLFVFSIAAFANDRHTDPIATEKTAAKKATVQKTAIDKDDKEKDRDKDREKIKPVVRRNACTTCTGVDPRFDIGGYFVEFINRNNLKLVKLLTE